MRANSFQGACSNPPTLTKPIICVSEPSPTPANAVYECISPSHPPNLLLVHVLVETLIQMLPPLEQQRITDELEPGRELQSGIIEHCLQAVSSNVSSISNFVKVGFQVNISLDEEDVINWARTTLIRYIKSGKSKAYSHVLPISHRSGPCNEFWSGT
jgi:hypothetical protein